MEEVRSIDAAWRADFDRFQEKLFSSYGTQASLFEALEAADFLDTAPQSLVSARSLDPPPEFEDDHQHWVGFLAEVAQGDRYAESIEKQDLLGLLDALDDGAQTTFDFLTAISPPFCRALVANDPDRRWRCPLPADVAVTSYEREAYKHVRIFTLATANAFVFPLDMTEAQRSERLNEVQPRIEQALETLLSQVESLNPPPALLSDHEALLTYAEDQLQTAREITWANTTGNRQRLQELFMKSNTVLNELRVSVSEDFRPMLAPLLAEPAS